MTTELKPCPFCGGEAKHRATDGYHYVICSNGDCKVMPETARYDSAEEADFAWNVTYGMANDFAYCLAVAQG